MTTTAELEIEATDENLEVMQGFIEEQLADVDCSPKTLMQIALAAEEIFVNVAHYAYAPHVGKVTVRVEVSHDPLQLVLTFLDQGVPFDPLAKDDPDVTLAAHERAIGGLGVFITKKVMDHISYEYKNGSNILRMKKDL